jgi:hypothetical protein
MQALLRTLRGVVNDLLAFRNVDAYVVVAIGVALIVFDVLGNVDISLQLTVVIAALVVMISRMTAPAPKQTDLNDLLHTRKQFGPFRDFIAGGRTLWIYSPSAINILRDPSVIKEEILDKGGSFVMLIQDPTQTTIIEALQQQLDVAALDLKNDITVSSDIIRKLKTRKKEKITFDIVFGYLAYSPGFSLTIVDAERSSGRLIVEFFGFQNEFIGSRMHINITRQQSEYWFEYWVEQFREMQSAARIMDVEGAV